MARASTSSSSSRGDGTKRVLRIGLVLGSKIIEERLVHKHEHVTIGPNERATFVLQAPGIPSSFRIFEREGDHYRLQITPQMGLSLIHI